MTANEHILIAAVVIFTVEIIVILFKGGDDDPHFYCEVWHAPQYVQD